jgi:hypothetical protein
MSSDQQRTRIAPAAGDTGHSIFTFLKRPLLRGRSRGEPMPDESEAPAASDGTAEDPQAPPLRDRNLPAGLTRRPVSDIKEVPDWLPESQLEHAAPNAVALLTRVWGTPAAAKVLRALVFDGRRMARRWRPAVWGELALLCAVHRHLHPAAPGTGGPQVPDVACLPLIETGYRHVLERLIKSWGHVEAFALVCHDLFFDHRGGRAGWPAEVWEDLVLAQQVHDRVHGRPPADHAPGRDFFLAGSKGPLSPPP